MASRLESAYQIILQQTFESAITVPSTNKIQTFRVSSLEFIDNERNVISFLNIIYNFYFLIAQIVKLSFEYISFAIVICKTFGLKSKHDFSILGEVIILKRIFERKKQSFCCCLETIDYQFI